MVVVVISSVMAVAVEIRLNIMASSQIIYNATLCGLSTTNAMPVDR
jgi:hypothetical protein